MRPDISEVLRVQGKLDIQAQPQCRPSPGEYIYNPFLWGCPQTNHTSMRSVGFVKETGGQSGLLKKTVGQSGHRQVKMKNDLLVIIHLFFSST